MPQRFRHIALLAAATVLLAGCATPPRPAVVDPDSARASIQALLPATVASPEGWAIDIHAAFEALDLPVTADHVCGVLAVIEQESNFQVDPVVPGLPAIARREFESRAASHHVPKIMVNAALALRSPDGHSYGERLDRARTEQDLSNIYEDFIRGVPLGERLFGKLNPVHTGGPMQVGIAFAERQAKERHYPYPLAGNVRAEVFTRRGGLYFGIAHLLDYATPYDDMLYRFADYNAGRYASRNAAFQNAVNIASGRHLALDGDLLVEGSNEPSATELAIRSLGARLDLGVAEIRRALEQGDTADFGRSPLYVRTMALADSVPPGRPVPRALVPRIALKSPKITRSLTTEWFARRVDERYRRCLARTR